MQHQASYTYLSPVEWDKRIDALNCLAGSCALCPRRCAVNRMDGERGYCGAPGEPVVSSVFPHHGEEPSISGRGGSGTVFFTYCTLKCIFCQNFQLSHEAEGSPCSVSQLAEKMLNLQAMGCHNVNLVTATHFLPWVIRALREACLRGLTIPVVYNCGGYELVPVLSLLSGIVDIYLPDMKYGDNGPAKRYSKAPDYVEINRKAVREMFRQVGPLRLDESGIAYRGLCIRHLVLPNREAGTHELFSYLTSTYDPQDLYVSLMAQYRPLHKAATFPEIDCMITREEYKAVKKEFIEIGFCGFCQEPENMDDEFIIDFKKRKTAPLIGRH
jgi:putative pyruvate formate lyase activating enzyme